MTCGIGIIGAGMIAPFHLEAIEGLPNARAVGIMDNGSGRGRAIAPQLDPAGADDLDAFLARDDVDVITIATPSGTHLDAAVKAPPPSAPLDRYANPESPAADRWHR